MPAPASRAVDARIPISSLALLFAPAGARATWSEPAILAITIAAEARGESHDGKRAVAAVIRNRVLSPRWWGRDVRSVCLAPWQFSCWNTNDRGAAKRLASFADPQAAFGVKPWESCVRAAAELLAGAIPADLLPTATHYHAIKPGDPNWPSWATKETFLGTIGRHRFYAADKL